MSTFSSRLRNLCFRWASPLADGPGREPAPTRMEHHSHSASTMVFEHILALESLGWMLVVLRPDVDEGDLPPTWEVTVERRHDGRVRISTSGINPEAALESLMRYAKVDAR